MIVFGTDGWRAVIADGFTFDNVRRVSSAIAVAARTLNPPKGIDRNSLVVGYDRRFLSREFAQLVAETLRSAGYRVLLSNAPTPLQTIVDGIRGDINPAFGGVNPEPIPENLVAARNVMLTGEYDIALCNDGDADRLGVLDERGEFVSPHKIISLLALYLVREKKMQGDIVKTFSTTRLIERVAKALGAVLHETPIGFKYVADLMLSRNILIGGEESGGIGFGRFIPERDGVLSGLLVAECVAHFGLPLSTIVARMENEFGQLHYDRRDIHRPMEVNARLIERVRAGDLDDAFGDDFTTREEKDGAKMNFADGSWILFRKSGTEPIIRIYSESPDASRVQKMLATAVRELDS